MTSAQPSQPVSGAAKTFVVDGVGLSIDGKAILSDVSLEFPAGEVVALVGHNGSGKSSLLKILARQQNPSSGGVAYGGSALCKLS